MSSKVYVLFGSFVITLVAATSLYENDRNDSAVSTVARINPAIQQEQQEVTPKQVFDLIELLSSSATLSCEQIRIANNVAVQAHDQRMAGWDSLLQEAAIHSESSDCGFDHKSWYLSLASDSAEPPLRSHAFLRLGWLDLHAGNAKQAVSLFQSCLDSLPATKNNIMMQDIKMSAIHGQANAMAKNGDVQSAAAVHLQAVAMSASSSGNKSPSTLALLGNQARLYNEAKNFEAACTTLDAVLESQPVDPKDFDEYLLNSIRRYQTAQRVANAKPEDGVAALETAWSSQRLWVSPQIVRVGWELVQARLKQGQAPQACDLAVRILDSLQENTKAWTAAIDPDLRAQASRDLTSTKMSCISTLQSFSLHHNKDYLNYAYMSWLEEAPDAESQVQITTQWNNAVRSADEAK